MSACEKCWTEASRLALLTGKSAADYYPLMLAKNELDHAADDEAAS